MAELISWLEPCPRRLNRSLNTSWRTPQSPPAAEEPYSVAMESPQRRSAVLSKVMLKCLVLIFSFAAFMLSAISLWANAGGSVSGTVKDGSGAVISSATVEATNIDTGVQARVATNSRGFYSFPGLPVGRYNIDVKRTGFKPYQRTGVTIYTNGALTVDAVHASLLPEEREAIQEAKSQAERGEFVPDEVVAAFFKRIGL